MRYRVRNVFAAGVMSVGTPPLSEQEAIDSACQRSGQVRQGVARSVASLGPLVRAVTFPAVQPPKLAMDPPNYNAVRVEVLPDA